MALCDTYLSDIDDAYESAHWMYNTFIDARLDWLMTYYSTSGFNLTWRTNVALSIINIGNALERLIHCNLSGYHPLRLPYYLTNCLAADEYELTWQKICEAWVANDFEGKEWTIAVIDRMRTLMWDKPFDIKWAASPTAAKG